jgi:aryl sulfotransferase
MRAAARIVRTWHLDSRRWDHYRPRRGDVVIATHPKCGTTWMQQIVGLLIFGSPEPRPVTSLAPWIEGRFVMPIEETVALIEAQTHRRFLKSHLPFDALPAFDEVSYIHVARAGLDVFMSWHNHSLRYKRHELLDKVGLADETIARPYLRPKEDLREFFHDWLEGRTDFDVSSFHAAEKSFWAARREPNVLLVHYNDLLADLDGEMRRIAAFLNIVTPEAVWPSLVQAARFDAMKRNGETLIPHAKIAWEGGHVGFLHAGSNQRWRDRLSDADIALYHERAKKDLPPALSRWLSAGRLASADPRTTAD